ncbi:glycoside hydrolase family 2 protein [Effusibacillus pohliae]|uniref:glycoside hydrolase family 2 protein n=1 Tax=Effusibacillus pohliae TaxID=232270 RepID=UPI0003617703|nr:glycoside hydrolase family 2 [Effusibacillus pohliae]
MRIDLNGEWEYRPLSRTCIGTDGGIREDKTDLPAPGVMTIPQNWELAGVHNFAGRIEFVKHFSASPEQFEGKMVFLRFDGVDYFAKVYLNDRYIGEHEGYFQPFEFDVSGLLKEDNVVKVIVDSPMEDPEEVWPDNKLLIKGVLNHHDARPGGCSPKWGQSMNTGGIWNDVYLDIRPYNFIESVKWIPILLKDGSAKVTIRPKIYCTVPGDYQLRIKIDGQEYVRDVKLQTILQEKDFVISIQSPKLWWTWDLGEPYLYRCEVELFRQDQLIHKKEFAAGIRSFTFDAVKNQWLLNNKPIFIRGTNIIPAQWLSGYTQEKIEKDVELIKNANINSVRVHAHITRKEFYEACDREGVLIWQDFALQWSYSRSDIFAENAVGQIKEMVDILYNHASIGIWCCHNEPSVNTEELDPLLYQAVCALDSTRYVHEHSDFSEHPYPGWYYKTMEEFMTRPYKPIVSEFGAQALPNIQIAKDICGKTWPPDWERMAYHNFQYDETFHVARIKMGDNLEELVRNSQEYQARLLKFAIEEYRLDKYNNLGGLYQFMFVDCWPSITWAVIDYDRIPKLGYYALKKAYQPVLPVARMGRTIWTKGKHVEIKLYIINDYHKNLADYRYELSIERHGRATVLKDERFDMEADAIHEITLGYSPSQELENGAYKLVIKVFDNDGQFVSSNDYDVEIVSVVFYQ